MRKIRILIFAAAALASLSIAFVSLAQPALHRDPAGDRLPQPDLTIQYDYEAYLAAAPDHYTNPDTLFGDVAAQDNTPAGNPVTNAGAALGRVLFYDPRLSADNSTSCASCHRQENGFADTTAFSRGFAGDLTGRNTPGLSNARYYARGHFFWDERAATLEDQVLMPIQSPAEMGMALSELTTRLAATDYYPALFTAAFGDSAVTSERISLALAQFVRAMVSYQSPFDAALAGGAAAAPDFAGALSEEAWLGLQLFADVPGAAVPSLGCAGCHQTAAVVSVSVENIGLDAVTTDAGAGAGRFKAPSLRNVAVSAPYMHDGRFATLEEVIDFYDSGIADHPDLSPALRAADGTPARFHLTAAEKAALVAFLETLTDEAFLHDPAFADPFAAAAPAGESAPPPAAPAPLATPAPNETAPDEAPRPPRENRPPRPRGDDHRPGGRRPPR